MQRQEDASGSGRRTPVGDEALEPLATPPFGLEKDAIVQYACWLGTIAAARGRDVRDVEGDREPLELEERSGREDAQAYAEA